MYYAILFALLFPIVSFAQSCSVDSFADSVKAFISSRVDSRFTANETRLATCEANHTSHFSSINLLTLDLNAAKDDITALRADVTSAENIISDHETRLTTLETLMSSIPTGSSTFKTVTQTAHGFAVGDWVYLSGTSTYAKADADAAASSESVGVVTNVPDVNTFVLTTEGYATGLTGLVAGSRYYISTTAGAVTAIAPTSNIKAVFIADTTTSGYVQQYAVGASSQALTYGRVKANANLASISYSITSPGTALNFDSTLYSSGMTFSGTNGITPSVAGRYRASWLAMAGSGDFNDDGTFHIVQNGVSLGSVFIDIMQAAGVNQIAPFIDVDLAAGQTVTLNYQPAVADSVPWGKGSYFQLTQLPTASSTVVDGTVAVNDQAATGYFDIGTMRMQWGTHNDGNVDTTTVTLPAAFANTSYSVVATSNTSAGSLDTESKTTTTFDIDRASTTTTTQVYSWFAIGLKP